MTGRTAPLEGLRVVDVSTTLTGAHVTQTLADFGASVVLVEPPEGTPLRRLPAWPFWGRGKRSVVLDLSRAEDRNQAGLLAQGADVVLETWRPGVAERLDLGYDDLSKANPGLVYASITGFGRDNPLSHLKAYEPIVMAKIGMLDAFAGLTDRPGPSYVATPYCAFSASQLCLHGILAALIEREHSGTGQRVDTTMVQGILAHDTWNWLIRLLTRRFSDAFLAAPPTTATASGTVPMSPLFLRLMVGFTKDGEYMQFSQMSERLWQAFLRVTGLGEVISSGSVPDSADARVALLDTALAITRQRTYAEWLEIFDREPDVWAERFRDGHELLDHPQLIADGRVVTVNDPAFGPVRQPGPLVLMSETPAAIGPALSLDAHHGELATVHTAPPRTTNSTSTRPPLEGVTVLEFGTYYAGPFGATLLADLGARVIKIEQLDGDPQRSMMPFPEIGGVKALQGKESVAVDITTPEGREIIVELVRRADIVLQTFRAGAAARHGIAADDLMAVNPGLVYLSAPGYGLGPPCGHRPAYAPTIGAGAGLAYRNVGGRANLPADPDLSAEEVREYSQRIGGATLRVGHADGFSALGVATALLLGLLARRRGSRGQTLSTSMLSTMAHCLAEDMIDYGGRADIRLPDRQLRGLGARYRLYETSDGWVFLAAPAEHEWQALAVELGLDPTVAEDDDHLASKLEAVFRADASAAWEARLTKIDVACAAVATGPVEDVVFFGGLGETLGILTSGHHPLLGDYPRLSSTVTLSRTPGVTGDAPLVGQDTVKVLQEIGFSDLRIGELIQAGIIAASPDS